MNKFFNKSALILFLFPAVSFAGGFAEDSIYTCSSEERTLSVSLGATDTVTFTATEGNDGSCRGRGWVTGADSRDYYCALKFERASTCNTDIDKLSWSGCFRPSDNFQFKANLDNGTTEILNCKLTKRGGSYYMDGSRL